MRTIADEYYSLYSQLVVRAQLTFRYALQIYSGKIIEARAENAFNPLLSFECSAKAETERAVIDFVSPARGRSAAEV